MVLFGNMKVPLGKTGEIGPTTIAVEKKGNDKLASVAYFCGIVSLLLQHQPFRKGNTLVTLM